MKQMLALALGGALGIAQAQEYPTKPIHVLVPFAPGGAVDTTARVLALAMQQRVNWQFVIENRPGATASSPPRGAEGRAGRLHAAHGAHRRVRR